MRHKLLKQSANVRHHTVPAQRGEAALSFSLGFTFLLFLKQKMVIRNIFLTGCFCLV